MRGRVADAAAAVMASARRGTSGIEEPPALRGGAGLHGDGRIHASQRGGSRVGGSGWAGRRRMGRKKKED